jgi:hypothetical protein
MAVPAYTTDLTDLVDLDTTGGAAVEPSSLYTAGRNAAEDTTDFPIQGSVHASLTMNATGKAGVLVPGSAFTWTSGDYMFGWIIWLSPGAIATYAAGGLSMILGDGVTNFDVHWVGGKDFGKYPYGGWQNFALDPERTPEESAGTPPTAYHYVGAGANVLTAVSKGDPLGFDVFRYGRGMTRIAGGQAANYANFPGLAVVNDAVNAKWGLFQAIPGGYQWKGLMYFGYGSLTLFTDSNVNILIENTELVSSDFNRIEIHTTGTEINWTNINFTALGTVAPGELEMIDNEVFNDTGGVFTDMATFIYLSNATMLNRIYRRCGQVTQGGASFTTCTFDESAAAVALVVDSLTDIDKCVFNSSGTGHAINLGTIAASVSMDWKCFDYGYALQAGTAANRTILVNVATSQILTLNKAAGTTTPTYYNTGAGTVVIQASISIYILVQNEAKTPLQTAYVYINDEDSGSAELSTDTDVNGEVDTTYAGAVTTATLRIRKYGYKPFKDTVDLSSNITRTITLVSDPQQT